MVFMTKNEIRTLMKEKRNKLSDYQRNELNKKIQDRLYALDYFKSYEMLFTYVSFGSEADSLAVIDTALKMGKRIFVPRVEGKEMNFYEIDSLNGLIRSKFGILEPAGSKSPYLFAPDDGKKLMLLPGLAFDRTGNRVGYGAGYYDRYLGRYPTDGWLKIGFAFSFQVTDKLPAFSNDIKVDYIVTDQELVICK